MKCDYGRNSRHYCGKEAVGKAKDKFGTDFYCEKHLKELEEGIKLANNFHSNIMIVRFYETLVEKRKEVSE